MDTWTHEDNDTGYASDFNCAHWIGEGVDLHLVGGNGGQIQTSPDGTNWTSRTAGAPIFGSIEGFAHAPDILGSPRILTVGGNGSTEECATSDDGIAWSAQAFAGVAGAASGCTWNNSDNGGSGQFVVGFFDGTIQWSDDGVNWNNEGVQFGDIRAITNNNQAGDGNSIYVAVGVAGSIIRSVNGQDVWTDETPGGGYAGNFWGVCWSEAQSLFMAVGGLSMMQTSPDGINWTDRSADIPAVGSGNNVYGCDYSVNLDEWVITGSGEYIATHPADVTSGVWTQRTGGEPTNTASPNILAVHVQDAPVAIGVGTLADGQYFRATVIVENDCAHARHVTGVPRQSTVRPQLVRRHRPRRHPPEWAMRSARRSRSVGKHHRRRSARRRSSCRHRPPARALRRRRVQLRAVGAA